MTSPLDYSHALKPAVPNTIKRETLCGAATIALPLGRFEHGGKPIKIVGVDAGEAPTCEACAAAISSN